MLGSKKKEEAFPVNEALLNVITPMGLEIKRNSLVIGENLGKVYGAVRYPQKVDMGWLSKITNIPSTIVSVGIIQTSSHYCSMGKPKHHLRSFTHFKVNVNV